ncbi:hypothetical protein ACFL6Y_09040 [Elusimicrobiota bacterium]
MRKLGSIVFAVSILALIMTLCRTVKVNAEKAKAKVGVVKVGVAKGEKGGKKGGYYFPKPEYAKFNSREDSRRNIRAFNQQMNDQWHNSEWIWQQVKNTGEEGEWTAKYYRRTQDAELKGFEQASWSKKPSLKKKNEKENKKKKSSTLQQSKKQSEKKKYVKGGKCKKVAFKRMPKPKMPEGTRIITKNRALNYVDKFNAVKKRQHHALNKLLEWVDSEGCMDVIVNYKKLDEVQLTGFKKALNHQIKNNKINIKSSGVSEQGTTTEGGTTNPATGAAGALLD